MEDDLGGPRTGQVFWIRNKFLVLLGIESRFLGRPALSLLTIPATFFIATGASVPLLGALLAPLAVGP